MAAPLPPCLYKTLNVPKDATLATITRAHQILVLWCHPDRLEYELASAKTQEEEQFYQVQQAYEILSDETRRQDYDEKVRLAKIKAETRRQDYDEKVRLAKIKAKTRRQDYDEKVRLAKIKAETRRQDYDEKVRLAKIKAERLEKRESFSLHRPYEHGSPRTGSESKLEYETKEPADSRSNKPNVFAATYTEARPPTSPKQTHERYTLFSEKISRMASASGQIQEKRKLSRACEDKKDARRRMERLEKENESLIKWKFPPGSLGSLRKVFEEDDRKCPFPSMKMFEKEMEDYRNKLRENLKMLIERAEELQRDRDKLRERVKWETERADELQGDQQSRRSEQNTRKDMETRSRGKFVTPATRPTHHPAQQAAVVKPFASSYSEASPRGTPSATSATLVKFKQGLVGSVNGANIAAMADTGSRENIISESYAENLGLTVEGSPSSFTIGNAQKIQSIGTVSLLWAFAENPKETFSILCHVLPRCTYSLILGNRFLKATETMSRFGHRLTKCLFSVVNNVSGFSFLGESCQRLEGTIADRYQIFAIPDTGSERNVMSLQYAIDNGLEIKLEPKNRGYLQFADGTYEKTVGQVETFWTFESGERIPITFEILRYCCSDVIIGEDILTEHNVFQAHAASISSDMAFEDDSFELAPFDFVNSWQRGCGKLIEKVNSKKDPSCHKASPMDAMVEERHRRSVWNHDYDFGASATTSEKELEIARRDRFSSSHHSGELPSDDTQSSSSDGAHQRWALSAPQQRRPVIPSISTSQSRR